MINKHKIYYEESGRGSPLLFIHGLGSSTKDWEYQISYFSGSFRVLSVDLRGHGKTGNVKGRYSIKIFADDIASILSKEKEQVSVIGISLGGMVAFQLAVDYPHLVKSMVVINSFVEFPVNNWKNKKALFMRKLIPKIFGMKILGKIIGKKVFPKENQVGLRNLIAKRWAENNIKDYIKSVNAIAGWTVKDQLYKINCPILIIGSEFDYVSNEAKIEYTKLLLKAKFIMISDAHHAVTVEKPNEVNLIISGFLNNI